jgi:hypothetical protein
MYVCFFINQLDDIGAPSEVIDAQNPIKAIEKAVAMLHSRPHYCGIEAWEVGKRLYPPPSTGGSLKVWVVSVLNVPVASGKNLVPRHNTFVADDCQVTRLAVLIRLHMDDDLDVRARMVLALALERPVTDPANFVVAQSSICHAPCLAFP